MILRQTPMVIRGPDRWGSGEYGASRDRGRRRHRGVDLVCEAGDVILSPVSGTVTKIGYPYDPNGPKGHKRYVQVTDDDGLHHRFFYTDALADVGLQIETGQPLAKAQGLQDIYPGITDHIHYEIKRPDGSFIDPTPMVMGNAHADS